MGAKMKENSDIVYQVLESDEGLQIKEILKRRLGLSSRLMIKLKKEGGARLNNEETKLYLTVKEGDVISVSFPKEESFFEPEDIPLDIVYEDKDILLINKQPGIVVHPTKGHPFGTVANAVTYYMQKKNDRFKIRFVNRLDRDTSGILIVAKNSFAQEDLSKQMKDDKVIKKYMAVVEGIIEKDSGVVDEPIGRENEGDIKRAVIPHGYESITHYRVIERIKNDYSVVELILKTGRTHQIRVHMSYIGHAVVGDTLYGEKECNLIDRQALHAYYLSFIHPVTKKIIEAVAPLPEDIQSLIEALKK